VRGAYGGAAPSALHHRRADPFGFWTSLSIGIGLFLAAAIVAARWLFTV
jgi:hypothetical protein